MHMRGSWAALKNPTIWHLGVLFFLANLGFYAYSIWSPQMIKAYVGATNEGVASGIAMVNTLAKASGSFRSNGDWRSQKPERRVRKWICGVRRCCRLGGTVDRATPRHAFIRQSTLSNYRDLIR